MSSFLKATAALATGPCAIVVALLLGFDASRYESQRELIHRQDDFVGAATCKRCHPDQHASWARTFHATMTQRPTRATVAGAFDDRRVTFYGKSARLWRDGERFLMDLPADGDKPARTVEIALAVGSRRYQQYFEKVERERGAVYRRLPLLWHIGAKRWLPVNSVFLGWDDPRWSSHADIWNQNCIFCHNTAPRPGYQPATNDKEFLPMSERAYDSHVASLGIACESCHGPGHEHVDRYSGMLARYGDYFADGNETKIENPGKLDKERSVAVCGQCHGQRIPKPIERHFEWRKTGPTYRSGDRLTDHVTPLQSDTQLSGQGEDPFRLRFWRDGTARLTAYEYQGITASACYTKGALTCSSCHTMHGGDVHGQIEPRMRGNAACLQCHTEIANDISAHTKHDAKGSGSQCMSCHMPRIVYGIIDVHRSHRIDNPDPGRDTENGRPNACTLCHLDKSPLWAADAARKLWGKHYERPKSRPDNAPLTLPDAIASLLAGDPVQRVVWAKHAGRADAALAPKDKAFLRVMLHATLLDAYPSIRWTAQRSLGALERELPLGMAGDLAAFDHVADKQVREGKARAMFDRLAALAGAKLTPPSAGFLVGADFRPDLKAIIALLNLQAKGAISIGE